MKEALGKTQRGVWVQPLGFQGLCLPFFVQVFTEQDYISSDSQIQCAVRSFRETLDNIHPVWGGHTRDVPLGSEIFQAGVCGSKGTALRVGNVLQHRRALGI